MNAYTKPIPEYAAELLRQQSVIETKLESLYQIISKARRGAMGLTLEEDKTPEWRKAKQLHDLNFAALRTINQQLNKQRKFLRYESIGGKTVAIYKYKEQ